MNGTVLTSHTDDQALTVVGEQGREVRIRYSPTGEDRRELERWTARETAQCPLEDLFREMQVMAAKLHALSAAVQRR